MTGEWESQSVQALQDIGILLVEDGNHGECRPRPDEFSPEGTAFIRAADLLSGYIAFSSASRINPAARARIRKGIGKPGDVILSHKGTVGKLAMAPMDCEPYVCSPQTTFWRVLNKNVLSRRFLYYFMHSSPFRRQLDAVKGETDMADYVSLTAQRRLRVPIPTKDEQSGIVEVLGALDDKIDLNRQMNETLEVMARAIFKDWVVDFGPTRAKVEGRPPYLAPDLWALFPDRLDEEGKPEGWEARPLDQTARFLNGLALQKHPSDGLAGLPVIKIAQLRAGMASRDEMASSSLPAEYIVQDGDLLFSWSGSLLHRIWAGGLGALNQHLFKVIPAGLPKWFVYCWIAEHMDGFRSIAASKATTMGHIQRHHLAEATAYLAAPAIMEAADNLIAPLFAQMLGNDLEARTLAATRDLLLPKLMSGEVRVREAESLLGAVA